MCQKVAVVASAAVRPLVRIRGRNRLVDRLPSALLLLLLLLSVLLRAVVGRATAGSVIGCRRPCAERRTSSGPGTRSAKSCRRRPATRRRCAQPAVRCTRSSAGCAAAAGSSSSTAAQGGTAGREIGPNRRRHVCAKSVMCQIRDPHCSAAFHSFQNAPRRQYRAWREKKGRRVVRLCRRECAKTDRTGGTYVGRADGRRDAAGAVARLVVREGKRRCASGRLLHARSGAVVVVGTVHG